MSDSPFQRRPRRIGRSLARAERGRGDRDDERGGFQRGPLLIGIAAVGLAIALLVLFVPPLALLDDDGDDEALAATVVQTEGASTRRIEATVRDRMPDVPDNLHPVSPIYDLTTPADLAGALAVTVRLTAPTQEQRNLGAYTYAEGRWQRLSAALLTDDGSGARAELVIAPSNIAILRRLQFQDTVAGRLPLGSDLSADAVNVLTVINPVGFVPAADGSLLGRVEALPPDITQPVYPVVLAETPEADIINTVIASPQLRRQHLNNILLMVQAGRYDGVDIDYRVISPALRDAFTEFISELADQLHRDGRGISLSVPLPSHDASVIDEGAYDLAALGLAVDQIKIVPPRDQSIYRETLVATLPIVLTRVPPEKVLLSLSPHAVEKSLEGYRLLTQRDALGVASVVNVREAGPVLAGQRVTLVGENIFQDAGASGLFWDRFANMVSFRYPGPTGELITVWIENRLSVAFKLQLAKEYELGGLALEDVSAEPANANLWPVITSFLESGEVPLALPNPELLIPLWEAAAGDVGGSGSAGWVVWTTPTIPGEYEVRLIVSDGDVRVGHAIDVTVEP